MNSRQTANGFGEFSAVEHSSTGCCKQRHKLWGCTTKASPLRKMRSAKPLQRQSKEVKAVGSALCLASAAPFVPGEEASRWMSRFCRAQLVSVLCNRVHGM